MTAEELLSSWTRRERAPGSSERRGKKAKRVPLEMFAKVLGSITKPLERYRAFQRRGKR